MLEGFSRLAAQWRSDRTRRRAAKVLEALPPELQRDIGYPDSEQFLAIRRRSGNL